MSAASEELWTVPELGPSLGRLVDAPAAPHGALHIPLDDVRLELVTGIFELAGASRSFAASGDAEGAVTSLGRVAWLGLWEKAVATVARRIAGEAEAALHRAAEESLFPKRRLQLLLPTDADIRAIAARIGSGGGPFVAALDQLEQVTRSTNTAGGRAPQGAAAWRSALTTAARRLESAWMALDAAARLEQDRWAGEVDRVRAWHRPVWPIWLLTALVLGAAVYLGLVLGGYLPVPAPLTGFAEFWWAHL
ncbi:MAG TPA: hypothetical protein VMY76_08825 [Gemmatimonadales bacterium]|nr:hypothetical protein [Gemmatimonadales bacterium]